MRIALLACIVACHSRGPATVSEFCKSYYDAESKRRSECFGSSETLWQALYSADTDRCVAMERGAASGRIKYDPVNAGACLELVNGVDCELVRNSVFKNADLPCSKALAGQVATDGACYSALDCVASNFCSYAEESCPGTCKAYVKVGAACGADDLCAPYAFCANGFCTQGGGLAESCAILEDGGSDCRSGYFCAEGGTGATTTSTAPTQRVCQSLKDKGGKCTGSGQSVCTYKHHCDNGVCAPDLTVGATCTVGECDYLSACVNGKCVADATIGAACGKLNANSDFLYCIDSFCDGPAGSTVVGVSSEQNGTCKKLLDAGAVCDPYGIELQCRSGICDSTNHCVDACLSPP